MTAKKKLCERCQQVPVAQGLVLQVKGSRVCRQCYDLHKQAQQVK